MGIHLDVNDDHENNTYNTVTKSNFDCRIEFFFNFFNSFFHRLQSNIV